MRTLTKITVFLLTFLTCLVSSATAEEPADVVNNWMSSCSKLNIDGMVSNYFEDASSFLTTHRDLVIGKAGVENYLRKATKTMEPTTMNCQFTAYTSVLQSAEQATIAGWDKITGEIDGKAFVNEGRISFILNKRNGIWKISHFHRSPLPSSKQ